MEDHKLTGILSALEVESNIILDEMSDCEQNTIAGMTFTKGRIYGKDIVLATCGVSKVNAALFTQIMIDHYGPERIIFTGVAGGMDDSIKQMDLIIADELTFYDVSPKQLELCFPYKVRFEADPKLIELISSRDPDIRKGLIITGDQFITKGELKNDLKNRFPDALAVEMEGCSVAQACFVNGVPFAVLRCISDLADDGATDSYQEFEKLAAEKSAGIILETLKELR